jgi:hypothetical protein
MDLNIIGLIFVGLGIAYMGYHVYTAPKILIEKQPERSGLLVAQDTGKSKQIQSKTGDASMHIQHVRRQTIKTVGSMLPNLIREGRTTIGSTTGAIETFFIGRSKA